MIWDALVLAHYLKEGIPMKAIQEWLGHSNFSTTANLYAHLDTNSKKLFASVLKTLLNLLIRKKIEESNASSKKNN